MSTEMTLAEAVYLLAFDPERGKLALKAWVGTLVQGASLVQLAQDGYLAEIDGEVHRARRGQPESPQLQLVLHRIGAHDARTWEELLHDGSRETLAAVESSLAEEGVLDERGELAAFQAAVHDTLTGERDTGELRTGDATLAALAALVPLPTVLSPTEKRRNQERIEFIERRAARRPGVGSILEQLHRTREPLAM